MTIAGASVVTVLLLVGLYWAVGVAQRAIIYPHPPAASSPPRLPESVEALRLGPNGDVEAWLLRPPQTSGQFPLLLFMHGNGELIDHWLAPFSELSRRGVGVLLVEYPGYGRSGGSPNQDSISQIAAAAYDLGVRLPGVNPDAIIAYGRSLGGGAACQLARLRPISGLILESTFTSLPELASRLGLPGFLVRDQFPNLSVVSSLSVPVMVIHGERDDLIPIAHGEALAQAANVPLIRLPCGHNDCPRPWAQILAFLERHDFKTAGNPDL